MSSRFLKKVLREQEQMLQKTEPQIIDEDEEAEEDQKLNSGSSINPFDLLDDDGHISDQEDEDETSEETKLESSVTQDLPESKGSINVVSAPNNRSKKKKKKKNKDSSASTHKVENPLDEILETLSLDVNASTPQNLPENPKASNLRPRDNMAKRSASSVLQVDTKYLNAENELRRIFGSEVVKSYEKSNQTGSLRQVHGARRGNYKPRKTILITPSEH